MINKFLIRFFYRLFKWSNKILSAAREAETILYYERLDEKYKENEYIPNSNINWIEGKEPETEKEP